MRLLKRISLFLLLIVGGTNQLQAAHLMGGEITWTCQGNGSFVFHMKLYRDCNGQVGPANAVLDVFNHPTLTSIAMNLVSQTDISPQCNVLGPQITCATAVNTPGAVEEFVYQSAAITISGTPTAAGWIFAFQNCCRNNVISNLFNPSAFGFTLRAIMFPYNSLNTGTCYDNSPEFLEGPKTITCTGYPYTYNHNASDVELDSLAYSWTQPLDAYTNLPPAAFNPGLIPFVVPFSFNSPMPGPTLNPNNVAAVLNPFTGSISYTSFTSGNYVSCIKVEAWRCGQKIAEIYRDIQVVLLPCGTNLPPSVVPPFQSNTIFQDTVYAGTLVNFTLSASDLGLLPNGQPQTITINASGQDFGAGFINAATGCVNPPCATLNAPPPVSGPFNVSTNFNWQTDCNHINFSNQCYVPSSTHNFVFQTKDDVCPAPAQTFATVSITVLALPLVLSPILHCVAVGVNGAITLKWEQPIDAAGSFDSYHIYSATNLAGPYVHVDSIFNYNQLTYTDATANGNAGPVYYFIKTRSGCGGMYFSNATDTLSSIFLTVVNSGNLAAILNWNNISNPAPATQYPFFRIYREYPAATWTLISSLQALTYIDSLSICNSQVNYVVQIGDSMGCISVSNVAGALFQDPIVPAIPLIDSVSVSSTNTALIGWNASTSNDVIGYVVYQNINGIWTAIDTVWGIGNTFYENLISNCGVQSEYYVVAAFDSCGNISVFSAVQNSIFLTIQLNICDATTLLEWNAFINMPGGVGGYSIYVSANAGPFLLAGTAPAGDSSFVHTGLNQFNTYCYYVVANNISNTITASSEQVCLFANVPQQPIFNYLRVASVAGSKIVNLKAYVDIAADVSRYDILRSDSLMGTYVLIGTRPTNPPNSLLLFTDVTPRADKQSYYYKMIAIDSCGQNGFVSNIAHTIYLQASGNNELTNTLNWNDYDQWSGGVSHYNIYRTIDGIADPVPISTVPFTNAFNNIYVDDVSQYIQYIGKFGYQIEGVEGAGNIYAFADTSYSNYVEVIQKPLVYVPNAFSPNDNGLNDLFSPSIGFIDIVAYRFTIFDRWGEVMFQTSDSAQGWNGRYNEHKCEPGVYVWSMTFKSASGQYIDRKGVVTLLR